MLILTGRAVRDHHGLVIVPCGLPGGPEDDVVTFRDFGQPVVGSDLPEYGAFAQVLCKRDEDGIPAVRSWRYYSDVPPAGLVQGAVRRNNSAVKMAVTRADEHRVAGQAPLVLAQGLRRNDTTGQFYEELVLYYSTPALNAALKVSDPNTLWYVVFQRFTDA